MGGTHKTYESFKMTDSKFGRVPNDETMSARCLPIAHAKNSPSKMTCVILVLLFIASTKSPVLSKQSSGASDKCSVVTELDLISSMTPIVVLMCYVDRSGLVDSEFK